MKKNPVLQAAILEVVDNQIRDGDPPESRETYERLIAEGFSDQEARRLIGTAVVTDIHRMLTEKKEYEREKYIKLLRQLPRLPWEE